MRLGTQTNSVINHLQSRGVIGEPVPFAGMGCTLLHWTDRDAGTIKTVEQTKASKLSEYIITVTRDKSRVISGSTHDGSAGYEFCTDLAGHATTFRKNRKTSIWEQILINDETGKWVKIDGAGIRIGERDCYRDPSF